MATLKQIMDKKSKAFADMSLPVKDWPRYYNDILQEDVGEAFVPFLVLGNSVSGVLVPQMVAVTYLYGQEDRPYSEEDCEWTDKPNPVKTEGVVHLYAYLKASNPDVDRDQTDHIIVYRHRKNVGFKGYTRMPMMDKTVQV